VFEFVPVEAIGTPSPRRYGARLSSACRRADSARGRNGLVR
jgi:hypothetical protein